MNADGHASQDGRPPLNERHLADLRASGLTDETIRAAGLYSADGGAIATLLRWQSPKPARRGGLVFPFRQADGKGTDYARVKPDAPRRDARGNAVKYESPRGRQNRAYFPPGFASAFASAPTVLVTEGEKKCLAAAQTGLCCIGLVGVWGFQQKRQRDDRGTPFGSRKLIADLAQLDWRGNRVVVVFDSDVADRHDLQIAEFRLAELLVAKGAQVKVTRLPKLSDGKTGLDDFLVHHGAAGSVELQRLIDAAEDAELPKFDGPMDVAKLLVQERFAGKTGLTLRYWREDFWRYTGHCYRSLSQVELTARVLRWLDQRGLPAKPTFADQVVKCLGALTVHTFDRNMPCWLDGEEHGDGWVSFKNGLFRIGDPANIQTMPHTARCFTPWSLEYAFDPRAECPTWIAFLDDVLDTDPERIDLLQRWFGLLLTTDTSFQKLLLLIGPPRAGKGTVVRVIGAMVGRDNYASPTLSSLAGRFGLAALMTKAVALFPDAHVGRHADGARVVEVLKSIVGEDPQDIERKFHDTLTGVRLPTRLVISCNELAHLSDPSGALSARLSVIPFFNSYAGREDRTLEARLLAELPGIVNWALVGVARLRAEGRLNIPTRSQGIYDSFGRVAAPVAAFMEDCLELHVEFTEPTDAVYAAWLGWARANGNDACSSARLGERLRAVNPSIERSRTRTGPDGEREYVYRGVRLTPGGHQHAAEGHQIREARKHK